MNKIPLDNTITSAYRFFFTRILSVIGTLWLPMLIMLGLIGGVLYAVVPQGWWHGEFPAFDAKNPDPIAVWDFCRPFMMGMPLLWLVGMVFSSMMMVGLMQLSLGQKKHCYAFFSLGADVWRLIFAGIVAFLIVMVIFAVSTGVAVAAGIFAKSLLPNAAAVIVTIVVTVVAICFCIYAPVRLCFFLPGVVVAEHRVGLGRSWQLGGGNFWRIVLVFLAIFLPVMIVAGIIQQVTILPIVASSMTHLMHTDKPTPADLAAFLRVLPPLIPVFVVVGVLQRIAMSGLLAGAIGTAYNALVPKPEESSPA